MLLLTGLVLACERPPEQRRHLLLVTVDTLRADALGVAGHAGASTPIIDRLAAEGTYFTAALSPMPRTTPAVASLLTGLWPHQHGSREVGDAMAPVPTLAEILRRGGYQTLAVSANGTAGPKQELDRGFDTFVSRGQLVERYGDGLDGAPSSADDRDPVGWATAVTEEALRLVAEVPLEEPFFLWLLYFDPHHLYRPPTPWRDVEAKRCWELYDAYRGRPERVGEVFVDLEGVASRAVEDCRRLYDAEVAYVDHELGRLLDTLAEAGRLEDTLIVFTSDHGENFGEGGLFFEHGDNAHRAGLAVPLIFHGPGVARGRVDDGVVSLVDVLPTVLGQLGWQPGELPPVSGVDLSPRLREEDPELPRRDRVVFAESATSMWNEAVHLVTTGRSSTRICIHGERFSLCEAPHRAPGAFQLFDHLADPRLTRDLAPEHPAEVERLRDAWRGWPREGGARQRVAQTDRFKLVQTPRLEGGYDARLFDLDRDPQEQLDVAAEHPRIFRHLLARLEAWSDEIPAPSEPRVPDPELDAVLRSLGYLR